MKTPYFSIVIPVFNRRRKIRRAIDSCPIQDFVDFELILVDDASNDDSVAVISSYSDPRVKLIRHERNRGQCPARNTGVAEAISDWIVFVDSDHALKPGALSRIHKQIEVERGEVDRLGLMQDCDTSIATPQPAPNGQLLDYEGWLRFIERSELSDFLLCTKRKTFEVVQFTDSSILEMEYQLNCALNFSTRIGITSIALASVWIEGFLKIRHQQMIRST